MKKELTPDQLRVHQLRVRIRLYTEGIIFLTGFIFGMLIGVMI